MLTGVSRRHGVTYTSPQEVYEEYMELCEAAEILGRPDLAAALRMRVTPRLCAKYAAILRVLKLCARNPLKQPLPEFSNKDYIPKETDPMDLYDEIMGDVREPEMYMGGDTSSDDSQSIHESQSIHDPQFIDSTNLDENPTGDSRLKRGISDPAAGNSQSDNWQTDNWQSERNSKIRKLAAKYTIAEQVSTAPPSLTQSMFVREAALLLNRQPCYKNVPVSGLSSSCSDSLWEQFSSLSDHIPGKPTLISANSIVDLLAKAENLVLAAQPEQNLETARESVRRWLQGEISVWPLQAEDLNSWCLPLLQRPELFDACLYAKLARQVFRVRPLHIDVLPDSELLYTLAIKQQLLRNGHRLLDSGLRKLLLDSWRRLSAVFLAQDARMLLFLDLCSTSPHANTPSVIGDLLEQSWPRSGIQVRLVDNRPLPFISLDIPSELEQAFGANFSHLFRPAELDKAWFTVLDAFSRGDQQVEFEMAASAKRVTTLIETQLVPGVYF